MPEGNAETTADILGWADLHGVDSHGIPMIPGHDRLRRSGRAKMQARPRVIKETPVSALVDGATGYYTLMAARDSEEFTADVTRFCNDLRAIKPVDPAQPVMVAGDPQWNKAERRLREGVPVGPGLLRQIREIAQACAAPWLLD